MNQTIAVIFVLIMCVVNNNAKCEQVNNDDVSRKLVQDHIGLENIGRSLIERGRTLVHHTLKRFMVLMPILFFKMGVAFSLLVLVTLVAVNNGFIGFMILVVGLSTVLARMQEARTKEHSIAYVQAPPVFHHASGHIGHPQWDRKSVGNDNNAGPYGPTGGQMGKYTDARYKRFNS